MHPTHGPDAEVVQADAAQPVALDPAVEVPADPTRVVAPPVGVAERMRGPDPSYPGPIRRPAPVSW